MPFLFCLPSQKGSAIKEKNLLLQKQILSFNSRPLFEGDLFSKQENGRYKSCVLLKKRTGESGPATSGFRSGDSVVDNTLNCQHRDRKINLPLLWSFR